MKKHQKVKKPFLTEAMGLIDQKKYKEGQMKIYEGAQVYFGIIQRALNPFPPTNFWKFLKSNIWAMAP